MNLFRHFFCSVEPTEPEFTTSLEWIEFPPNNFCLSGYIGQTKIAQAIGDYQMGKDFRLVKIDVYDGYRSKGYGSRMIRQLISEANKKHCSLFVFVGVSVKNTRAANLYSSRFNATTKAIPKCGDKEDYVFKLY